jgi:hypothetical protein
LSRFAGISLAEGVILQTNYSSAAPEPAIDFSY